MTDCGRLQPPLSSRSGALYRNDRFQAAPAARPATLARQTSSEYPARSTTPEIAKASSRSWQIHQNDFRAIENAAAFRTPGAFVVFLIVKIADSRIHHFAPAIPLKTRSNATAIERWPPAWQVTGTEPGISGGCTRLEFSYPDAILLSAIDARPFATRHDGLRHLSDLPGRLR